MKYIRIIILILSILCFGGCNYNKEIKNISYIKIPEMKNSDFMEFYGNVKSQKIADLSFESEGKIIFIPYTKGDYIKKGQVIARLDGELYKIKKKEQTAQLDNASIKKDRSKIYFDRMTILHNLGAISENDWEEAYYNYKSSTQDVKIQKEKLAYLNKQISYNMIIAPYDCYITEKYKEQGAYASIGEPIVRITGIGETQIEIMVDSNTVNKLKLNEKIIAKYNNKNYTGIIKHISTSSINDGGYLVKILLDKNYPDLKDGMSINVYIAQKEKYSAKIPLTSIVFDDEGKWVYKITDIKNNIGTIKKEKIIIGAINDNEALITSGINTNDIIIFKDTDKIKPNSKVRL